MGTPLRIIVSVGFLALIACGLTATLGVEGLLGAAILLTVVAGVAVFVSLVRRL